LIPNNCIVFQSHDKKTERYHGFRIRKKILKNISNIVVGKDDALELLLGALLADGHVLLEDVPGVGKTLNSKLLPLRFGVNLFIPRTISGTDTGQWIAEETGLLWFQQSVFFRDLRPNKRGVYDLFPQIEKEIRLIVNLHDEAVYGGIPPTNINYPVQGLPLEEFAIPSCGLPALSPCVFITGPIKRPT